LINASISFKGIDRAISSLNYRENSTKYNLISAIRSRYIDENSLSKLKSIETDELIQSIWDTGTDPEKIKTKRRNFSSVKSSINTDLKNLSPEDENPEKLTLTAGNVFDMTEEAKSTLLGSFTDAIRTGNIDLNQVADILKAVTEFLADVEKNSSNENDPLDIIKHIKEILLKASENLLSDKKEEIELDEDEELQEVEELDEETEEIKLDEDEELQEIDELNEEELAALEDFRRKKELAEHFDNALAERDKKYNAYVRIPAGSYTVGSEEKGKNRLELQQITMPESYMARYPVTNGLFEVFIEETGYITTAEKNGSGTVFHGRFKTTKGSALWRKSSGSTLVKGACWYRPQGQESSLHGKRNHPVVQVSVNDAMAFASWIGRSLPSEVEWEAAARTDMGFRYPWGNRWKEGACNIEKSSVSDTTPVDNYEKYANEFNIVDMLGNVMEWTCDQEKLMTDSKEPTLFNLAKGGGWMAKQNLTVTSRSLFRPNFTSNTIGFRCISEKYL